MKTILDDTGRIQLPECVRAELNVKSGDEVVFENHGGEWVLRAVRNPSGLCWKGNVLIHQGVCRQPADQILDQVREERVGHLSEGLTP